MSRIDLDAIDQDESLDKAVVVAEGHEYYNVSSIDDFTNESLYHTTADGIRMPLLAMSDQHVLNTINVFLRRMTEAKHAMTGHAMNFGMLAYGMKVDRKTAEEMFPYVYARLRKYIAEAAIRQLDISTQTAQLRELLELEDGDK